MAYDIKCLQCNKIFVSKRPNRKYCSLECSWASKDRIKNHPSAYTENEKLSIHAAYKENAGLRNGWLEKLAVELNRSKTNISRYAKEQGLTDGQRTWNKDNPGRPSVRILKCVVCGDSFEVLAADNTRKTCSDKCFHKLRSDITKRQWAEQGHPRGMLGKQHTEEYKQVISERVSKYWENVTDEELEIRRERQYNTMVNNNTLIRRGGYSTARGGKRSDLDDTYFRSRWEANYARYLNFLNVEWVYEPKTFIFEKIKRGTRSYTPDFYIPKEDKRIEVKGYLDAKSITKLKRYKKYFPDEFEKLYYVVSHMGCPAQEGIMNIIGRDDCLDKFEYYKEIDNSLGGLIDYWE